MSDDFYLFSRPSYPDSNWKAVGEKIFSMNVDDVMTAIISDKTVKAIIKDLSSYAAVVKLNEENIKKFVLKMAIKNFLVKEIIYYKFPFQLSQQKSIRTS